MGKAALLVLAFAAVSACTRLPSVDQRKGCGVYNLLDGPTDGLVTVGTDMASDLKKATPGRWPSQICWYQRADGNLVGMFQSTRNGKYDRGYVYEWRFSEWAFLKDEEFIVVTHERQRR
jgi:hypothetical protein